MSKPHHINDRKPNFYSDDESQFFLVRCFACDEEHGRENDATVVASGRCFACGWDATQYLTQKVSKEDQ